MTFVFHEDHLDFFQYFVSQLFFRMSGPSKFLFCKQHLQCKQLSTITQFVSLLLIVY